MEDFTSEFEKLIPSSGSSVALSSSDSTCSQTRLNPLAREWNPSRDRAPEENRGLFLTFSQEGPLKEYEISQFFNHWFGPCVEKVYVNRRGGISQCAKVVFRSSHVPLAVMGNEEIAKFIVNSKTMWCKRYKPRNSEN